MLEITLSMLINILHTKSENNILAISWKIMGGATKWVIKTTSYHGCDAIMHFPLPEVCTFIKNAMRIIPPIWYRLPKFGPVAHGLHGGSLCSILYMGCDNQLNPKPDAETSIQEFYTGVNSVLYAYHLYKLIS